MDVISYEFSSISRRIYKGLGLIWLKLQHTHSDHRCPAEDEIQHHHFVNLPGFGGCLRPIGGGDRAAQTPETCKINVTKDQDHRQPQARHEVPAERNAGHPYRLRTRAVKMQTCQQEYRHCSQHDSKEAL
jgi:hypothetical protein